MSTTPLRQVPKTLVFVCQAKRFAAVDASLLEDYMKDRVEPWMSLEVGPGQMFETRPIRVLYYNYPEVAVVTTNYTIRLNLQTGAAYRVFPDGAEYEFRGGIGTSDTRPGWIPINKPRSNNTERQ